MSRGIHQFIYFRLHPTGFDPTSIIYHTDVTSYSPDGRLLGSDVIKTGKTISNALMSFWYEFHSKQCEK